MTTGLEKKSRVLSGMRPTGRLHIGHYFGALQNWVRLQNDPAYDCFYFIADWHALTSDYADTSGVAENTLQIMIDYLAAGLDPAKSVIFQQSAVPEHAELHLLLSMVTPLGELERVPTLKFASLKLKEAPLEVSNRVAQRLGLETRSEKKMPFQFLDIEVAAYRRSKAIGHKNFLDEMKEDAGFFKVSSVLTEPQVMLTKTPRIPGLDGRKMSKSYGNAITLSESDADIRAKTKVMVTDPARKRRTDPGNPDVCPVYDWHKLFSAEEPGRLEWVRQGCTTAGIGCIECKAAMAENLIKWIAPVRERRVKWENDPKGVLEILDAGSKRARVVAQGTMERVREAVFGWGKKRKEIGGSAAKV